VAWTHYTELFIYNISSNFTLLYNYKGIMVNPKDTTQKISFSADSLLILLETDNHNPVQIFNLSSFTVVASITNARSKIVSVGFLDIANRYVLINCNSFTYAYDTMTSTLSTFNSTLGANSVTVDQNSSQLIADIAGVQNVMGINITIGGVMTYWH
jgi:hypothetical protein